MRNAVVKENRLGTTISYLRHHNSEFSRIMIFPPRVAAGSRTLNVLFFALINVLVVSKNVSLLKLYLPLVEIGLPL